MDELIKGIEKILEGEGIKKIYLYGSSFGGLLAQCFIYNHPEMVSKVILSNTGTITQDRNAQEVYLKRIRKGLKMLKIMPNILVKRLVIRSLAEIVEGTKEDKLFFKKILKLFIKSKKNAKKLFHCHLKSLIDFAENWSFESGNSYD